METAMETRAAGDRQFVTALARGLAVLQCFGPKDGWLGNQEIARRTGLAKPTVSRLTHTLTRLGYLRYSESLAMYALGNAVVTMGFSALAQMDVRQVARPQMQALAELTRTAVHLAVRHRHSMLFIDTYRSSAAFPAEIGSRIPMATTSTGHAYLCGLSEEQREALLEELRRIRPSAWPMTAKAIERGVREYQRAGYCLGLGEWRRELHAVAAPLVLADGSDPVVFTCSGAAFELAPEGLSREIGPRLLTMVGNIRSALTRD
jgi:DNA-binding IclR family transcriptional regulator